MKSAFRLCCLVLIFSSVSRGQTPTVPPGIQATDRTTPPVDLEPHVTTVSIETSQAGTPVPSTPRQTLTKNETSPMQPTTTTLTNPTAVAVTKPKDNETSKSNEVTTVATTTEVVPVASSKAAYMVLVLIIFVIIILCIILYMLRRASRTYSFDLHTPGPSRHQDEPTGTFGQVYVDDLNHPAPNNTEMTDLTTMPVANGTSPEPVEKDPSEENVVPQDPPETNDVQNSPSSSFSSSSDDDRAEKTSNKLSSSNLFFDAPEEQQQNENNNNNPSVGSSYPFVEINLDEPAWCDQFLTSSSVCSFPSSSSSS